MKKPLLFFFVCLISCSNGIKTNKYIQPSSNVLKDRIICPPGFERVKTSEGSFARYLRNLPLKPHGAKVHLYNGKVKPLQNFHVAVIDISLGKKDLQQCADAIMRLKAEYHFNKNQYDKIHFRFTSGHECSFTAWAQGYRPVVNGNNVYFRRSKEEDWSYESFLKYMETIFMYCGSYSLSKELEKVENPKNILPGDVFIEGGFPGHAVVVLDVADNKNKGQKVFLLAQSYMPAQDIHVLKNPKALEDGNPWYDVDTTSTLVTPEWEFTWDMLMRFNE